jgi:tetratricopeptide (TPR) repeat protein
MPEEQPLSQLAGHYLELIQTLLEKHEAPPPEQALECLISRDRIAQMWGKERPADAEVARLIEQGDRYLKALAEPLGGMPQLKDWRASFNPPAEAWWWHFAAPLGLAERFDWLWTALALVFLAISLSLVADISPRFLSGGPDARGALAVIGQSLLVLLTTSSVLTSAGREALRRIFSSAPFLRPLWEEAGLIAALLLLILLTAFYQRLPRMAMNYNDRGFENYQAGQLTSAQRDYERALKLEPDLLPAHYNLGLLYEDLGDMNKAKTEYQIALKGGLDVAYNNLARLYILEGEYGKAVPLLFNGLKRAQEDEVRYDLYKNLGWARLGQARYEEAQAALGQAIELNKQGAPAQCLLAQVLEALGGQPAAAEQAWETCLRYADSSRPDEDLWLGLARQHFKGQTSQEGEEK